MAFTNNTTYGTTAYSTGTFYDQSLILANDGSSLSSATLATVSELAIPLGEYERVQGIYTLWYDSDNTNELSYRIANLAQSDGSTAVATTIATQSIASVAEVTAAATPSAAGLECTGTYSTDGADGDTDFSGKGGLNIAASEKLDIYGEVSFVTDEVNDTAYGTKLGAKFKF